MKKPKVFTTSFFVFLLIILAGCQPQDEHTETEHGSVDFQISCSEEAQEEFEEGLAHLHHMMYEQARPHFETMAEVDPNCAMAHWGIAMTSFYPLWMPTPEELLERGKNAVETAKSIGAETEREEGYISAAEAFFADPEPARESAAADHAARLESWAEAQRELHENYPEDVDAASFYALAEISYAQTQFSPDEERDLTPNREAGELLEDFFEDHPEHPGLFHYLIHAYDSPQLAHKAEKAARDYDQIAPDSPHALHMPAGYGVAAPQARYYLEQQKWEEAAQLELGYPDVIDWGELPETKALFSYARGLGAARTGDLDQAEEERDRIEGYVSDLREAGSDYWAYMTEALGKAVGAWTLYERGEAEEALALMSEAADLEDSMDKHPITPGEIYPVRELYGELLQKEGRTEEAIAAFEASLERTPNRKNAQNRVEQIAGVDY